ncbi:MAG: cysteine desulfurase [Bacteroidales bacterium]|nr:cysteine desulfurase [Bacteroidales bacterium]
MFDPQKVRNDFPALQQDIYGKPLVYLDNAATTQKPRIVIDAVSGYYESINSNVHRGVHYLSQKATEAYESARERVRRLLNAGHSREIIFTRGTTESINLVAHSFGRAFIHEGDEVLISALEHHANIVPWQMACAERKAMLKVIPVDDNGDLILENLDQLLTEKTRIVAVTCVSNALGTVVPVREIIRMAHTRDIPVLIDGAQGIVHMKVDVKELDCDFFCFSGHKFYGPMGVGVLYGKERFLEQMPPYQTGGEMISTVTFDKVTFNELPFRFEAGTPNVADVIGLDKAIGYVSDTGMEEVWKYEAELIHYALQKLQNTPGVRIIGHPMERMGVISFLIEGIHPYDAGTIIDRMGVAIRTGHHCAQPVMDRFGIPGTLRASFALYNTIGEVDRLCEAINLTRKMFG